MKNAEREIAGAIRQVMEWAKGAGKFVEAEAPQVVRQMLDQHRWEYAVEIKQNLVMAVLAATALIVCGILETGWDIDYDPTMRPSPDYWFHTLMLMASVVSSITLIVYVGGIVDKVKKVRKILRAPKLYVFEWVRDNFLPDNGGEPQ
jgi:hypothetical protein